MRVSVGRFAGRVDVPSGVRPAGRENPPLSNSDENAVMGWIAGRVSAKQQPYCYKQSYGRGVGVPLSTCPAGQEKNGLICYPDCRASYGGVGPVCWQGCPSGYVDTGALCHIDKALTTGGSWECTKRKWGVCWWKAHRCPSGYTNAGAFCALNTPSVPAGYKGLTGLDIEKNSYGQGGAAIRWTARPVSRKTRVCATSTVIPATAASVPFAGRAAPKAASSAALAARRARTTARATRPTWSSRRSSWSARSRPTSSPPARRAKPRPEPRRPRRAPRTARRRAQEASAAAKAGKALSPLGKVKAAWKEYKTERAIAGAAVKYAKVVKMWVDSATSSFAQLTTPEVTATLNQKFAGHPKALLWVEQQYAMQNLTLMLSQSEGDTTQSIQGGLSMASGFHPTGVTSTIAEYKNTKCNNADAFPNVKLLY